MFWEMTAFYNLHLSRLEDNLNSYRMAFSLTEFRL